MRAIFVVSGKHCSKQRLQLRLMRAIERARLNGWCSVISDTTDNMHSANNFIRAGYRLFSPRNSWVWPHTPFMAHGCEIAARRGVPQIALLARWLATGPFCVFGPASFSGLGPRLPTEAIAKRRMFTGSPWETAKRLSSYVLICRLARVHR